MARIPRFIADPQGEVAPTGRNKEDFSMLRTGNLKWYCLAALLAATLVLGAGTAAAQSHPDTFWVTYYSNAHETGAPDGHLRLDNPGVDNSQSLCADVYVLDAEEELLECCGCSLSADDLRTFSINNDLTANTANGEVPVIGVIKVISAAPNPAPKFGQCDPTGGASFTGFPNNIVPTPDIRGWATHIYFTGRAFLASDQTIQGATLSTWELDYLQKACFGIRALGSGRGVCKCGTGH
jgi:hypothetical protein